MVETVEQEALRLLNSERVRLDMEPMRADEFRKSAWEAFSYRLIEERRTMEADHQAFREAARAAVETGGAVLSLNHGLPRREDVKAHLDALRVLSQFIPPLPPADPLVAVARDMGDTYHEGEPIKMAAALREAIAKHGLKIERTEA